jgi:hypothetical protein
MLKKTMRRDEQSPIANQRSRIAITGADILTFSLHLRFENAGASGDIEENNGRGGQSPIANHHSAIANP